MEVRILVANLDITDRTLVRCTVRDHPLDSQAVVGMKDTCLGGDGGIQLDLMTISACFTNRSMANTHGVGRGRI